jgi:hypothetical protein
MWARRRYRLAIRVPLLTVLVLGLLATSAAVGMGAPDGEGSPVPGRPGTGEPSSASPEQVTRLSLGDLGPARADGPARRRTVLSRPATQRFSAVGVTWAAVAGRSRASVAVRVRRTGGWTGWQVAGEGEDGPDGPPKRERGPLRDGAELQWWGPADGLEVAVTALAGPAPRDVAVDLIDPGERPDDAVAAAAPPAADGAVDAIDGLERAAQASPYLRPRVAMPAIVRRAGWGANERKMRWDPEYVAYLKAGTVHHTATTNSYRADQVPGILRAIYHFHAVSRGWGDIGYNVLVDRFGRLWEGRAGGLSRPVVGAHSGGYNSYTTGVSFIGDHRGRAVPARSRRAAARFLAWKFSLSPGFDPRGRTRLTGGGSTSKYPPGTTITVYRVHGHRRTNATTCPGARGVAALGPLRRGVNTRMGVWTRPSARRTRLTVWRPSTASWYVRGRAGAVIRGSAGDVPVVADFDGDGTPDLTTWTPATGTWTIRYSASRRVGRVVLGAAGHRPVPADTDGNGRIEAITWDPATGLWHRRGVAAVRWGTQPGDVPVPGDYSGDGRADLAVWRPSSGTWHIRGVGTITLGSAWHVPVPADYDGNGTVDPATWSPHTQRFFVHGRAPREYGQFGDVPLPGQYDGDAAAELAVWGVVGGRGRWLIEGIGALSAGTVGDQPIPAG